MAGEWYWKHRGETRGPISTEDLDDLIRRHRIDNRDELRPVASDVWISAKTVKTMFSSKEFDTNATVEAANHLLKQKRSPLSHGNPASLTSGVGSALSGSVKNAKHFVGGAVELVVSGVLAPFLALRRFYTPWVGLVASILILVSIPLSRIDLSEGENQKVYDQLSGLVNKVRQLDEIGAGETEWKSFEDEHKSSIKASRLQLIETAEKQAGQFRLWRWDSEQTNQLTRRSLIQIAHHLEAIPGLPAENRSIYLSSINRDFTAATEAISGRTLASLKVKSASSRAKKGAPGDSIDPIFVAILAVDAFLLLGGGIFVWRRFNSR